MNDANSSKCECGDKCNCGCCACSKKKIIFIALGMILLAGIIITSLLRERWANPIQNQVTIFGQGKVEYKPDMATVILGVQVDKASSAELALNQLNEKMNNIISAIKNTGISEDKIKTESYTLNPQYDYKEGISSISGYGANQQLTIKIDSIKDDPEAPSQVISEASKFGANQVNAINFSVSNLDQLKQQARIKAIEDAKKKSISMFKAAGMGKPGKIVGWYENLLQSPDSPYQYGMGGEGNSLQKSAPAPQVPSGMQEIVVEIGVNYEVK